MGWLKEKGGKLLSSAPSAPVLEHLGGLHAFKTHNALFFILGCLWAFPWQLGRASKVFLNFAVVGSVSDLPFVLFWFFNEHQDP